MSARLMIFSLCAVVTAVSCGGPLRHSEYYPEPPTQVELDWEKAHASERIDRLDDAETQYASLCDGAVPYIRACYDRCRVLFVKEDVPRARKCAEQFILQHPNHGLSPAMIKLSAGSYLNDAGFIGGAESLESLAGKVLKSDVWDSIHFQRARLFGAAGMQHEEEQALMLIVEQGRWGSQLWDNAIWRVAAIQREKDALSREKELLIQLLAAKENSRLIASYNSPHFDDALFRLGEIYRRQNNPKKAYDAFHRLSRWETSRLRDDALLQCALLRRGENDTLAACMHLNRLLQKMPGSSSVRKAKSLLTQWNCAQPN